MSSAPGPSRVRAASPAQAGFVQGGIEGVLAAATAKATLSDANRQKVRLTSLGLASTFSEIMGLVPTDFREALRPELRRLVDLAAKKGGVDASLNNLRKHVAAGTFPSQILGMHVPKLQITKDWAGENPDEMTAIADAHFAYQVAQLSRMVSAKEAESAWLGSQIHQAQYLDRLTAVVDRVTGEVEPHYAQAVMSIDGQTVLRWDTSTEFKRQVADFKLDLPHLCTRLIIIERNKQVAVEQKAEAKKKLKEAADIEMSEDTTEQRRISDLVEKAVAARLKSVGQGSAGKKKPAQKGKGKGKPAGSKKTGAKSSAKAAQKAKTAGHKRKASQDLAKKGKKKSRTT